MNSGLSLQTLLCLDCAQIVTAFKNSHWLMILLIRTFAPQHCLPRKIMVELPVKKFFEFAGGKRRGKSG